VMWAGSMPCHHDGAPISRIAAGDQRLQIAPGLEASHRFSSKPLPAGAYGDYYEQLTAYIKIISHEAEAIDPTASAATFAPVETTDGESVFRYHDTASSRAGITMANSKLELGKLAIVGVGGTGSYVLDLVAKTPVKEIHLFDGDRLLNHNAFRAPGAVSLDELRKQPVKADYFAGTYARFRRGVVSHPYDLGEPNAHELDEMEFVFLCMDGGPEELALVKHLESRGISFIDVGMGLREEEGSVGGILRVTTSTPEQREHIDKRISFADPDDAANDYARNVQVADMNALNACLAVIRWKKLFGFYRDLEREHHTLYTIDGNQVLNEDRL
jgi:hypothetical protein